MRIVSPQALEVCILHSNRSISAPHRAHAVAGGLLRTSAHSLPVARNGGRAHGETIVRHLLLSPHLFPGNTNRLFVSQRIYRIYKCRFSGGPPRLPAVRHIAVNTLPRTYYLHSKG